MKSEWAGSGADGLYNAIQRLETVFAKPEFKIDGVSKIGRIIAVDPGTITGVSVFWFHRDSKRIAAWAETLLAHEENMQVVDLQRFLRLLEVGGPVDVVIENFRVMRVAMEETFLSPVRIGRKFEWSIFEGMAHSEYWHRVRIFWHWPSEMSSMNDGRLRKLGYFTKGPDHRRDATRHALLHHRQIRTGKIPGWQEITFSWVPETLDNQLKLKFMTVQEKAVKTASRGRVQRKRVKIGSRNR